jgi:anaerobic selenocysteine-containing dehydrogenase
MGVTARDQQIELPIPWTDCWDNEHATVTGNPVAFHAMRGLAAHSNGFHTIRALGILMSHPGHHRPARRLPPQAPPIPRPIPPCRQAAQGCRLAVQPNSPPWTACPWAGRPEPEDLFVDDAGEPLRIDKAFSWEYPLWRCTA